MMTIALTDYQVRLIASMLKRLAHAAAEDRAELVDHFAEDLIAAERRQLSRQLDAIRGLPDRELVSEFDKLARSYRRGML